VAHEWTCARGAAGLIDEPLYRYPALAYQAEVHAAVNIGLARAALDIVTDMAGGAKIMPGALRLSDRAYYKIKLGVSEAKWRSARMFFYDACEQAWEQIVAGNPVTEEIDMMLKLRPPMPRGSRWKSSTTPTRPPAWPPSSVPTCLQRIVRDAMVVTQHAALSELNYESAGALFAKLGIKR
jgi:alkylation response protein AidB-like acyl-CoA dehydrogenase